MLLRSTNSESLWHFIDFLVDSGGQYENGCTTDVTRTFHFGDPEPDHIEMYTRVLMGAIDLVIELVNNNA